MACCGSKNDFFAKNQELVLLPLKCKPTPVAAKSARACAKFKIQLRRFLQWNDSWYAYFMWSIFYVGCFAQLSILHFGSRFTKKPSFNTPKIEKHFLWDTTKYMLQMMIWMSYLDSSHFSNQFRYIIYQILINGFVNMDYSILNGKI
jgi:hypothetical protein